MATHLAIFISGREYPALGGDEATGKRRPTRSGKPRSSTIGEDVIGNAIDDILDGRKTIECRLSQKKIAPYGCIKRDDLIYLKQAGGEIQGEVMVDNVLFFTLDDIGLKTLRRKYQRSIQAPRVFWKDHGQAKYASLIFLKKPRRYLTPLRHIKKDRRAWVVLSE